MEPKLTLTEAVWIVGEGAPVTHPPAFSKDICGKGPSAVRH